MLDGPISATAQGLSSDRLKEADEFRMELAILFTVGLPEEERIEAEAKILLDVRERKVDVVLIQGDPKEIDETGSHAVERNCGCPR